MDFLEPLTLLAYLAGITKRVKLGTSVLVLPMRQPVLHAKIMATIDALSGGRFVLGAGVGWWKEEYEALSVPFERRGKRMDECLQLVRALWTEEFVDFKGEFYECVDWACNPKPVQAGGIPIWLGGESRGQLRRVGKYADGWLATAKSLPTIEGRLRGRAGSRIEGRPRPEGAEARVGGRRALRPRPSGEGRRGARAREGAGRLPRDRSRASRAHGEPTPAARGVRVEVPPGSPGDVGIHGGYSRIHERVRSLRR